MAQMEQYLLLPPASEIAANAVGDPSLSTVTSKGTCESLELLNGGRYKRCALVNV